MFKKWHCYVGFDIYSGSGVIQHRATVSKGLMSGKERNHNVKILGTAVRGRLRKLLTAGLAPQVLHHAQVVGSTDTELEQTRRLMGQMLGILQRQSTTAGLLSMPSWVDPISRVTIPLVKNWLHLIWAHQISYSTLNNLFRHQQGLLNHGGGGGRGKFPFAAL